MTTRTMVLLKHQLPGGSFHYDLMVQFKGPGAPLKTWRVDVRVDELRPASPDDSTAAFTAQPLGDHRAVYLDFEGDISGGRGTVTRVAEGVVHAPAPELLIASDQTTFDATWTTGPNKGRRFRYTGGCDSTTGGGGLWKFLVLPV